MNTNKPFWLWIKSFISGRFQVNLRQFIFYSNVPSWSPTLFNIYIDDLKDSLQELLKVCTEMYGDDCTQQQIVSAYFGSNLQQSINELNTWATLKKMAVNAKKKLRICRYLSLTLHPNPAPLYWKSTYRVNVCKLPSAKFQNNIKWKAHVEEITRQANKRLFHLRECRESQLPVTVSIITYQS